VSLDRAQRARAEASSEPPKANRVNHGRLLDQEKVLQIGILPNVLLDS
jgi:hypothetical protein